MATDPKRRQKQLARKKAKRKVQTDNKKTPGGLVFGKDTPVYEALMPRSLFESGLGIAVLSREMEPDRMALSTFLVDVYCLGIKDASFAIQPRSTYIAHIQRMNPQQRFEQVPAKCLRKLVEDAAAYAQGLGFKPHKDYRRARNIFGNIDAGTCDRRFEFGREGKPFFVVGPHDTASRCKLILRTLEKNCGEGNYHFLMPGEGRPLGQGVEGFTH